MTNNIFCLIISFGMDETNETRTRWSNNWLHKTHTRNSVINSSVHWKYAHNVEWWMLLLLRAGSTFRRLRSSLVKNIRSHHSRFFSLFLFLQIIFSLFDWLWRQQQQLLHELQLYSGIDTTASPTCAFLCRFYLWMLLDAVLPPSQRHTLAVVIVLFFQFILCFDWTKFG